jgi:diketogulonate reductase-like aldo/keto reductase
MLGIGVCNGETMDVSNFVFENIDTAYSIGGVIIVMMIQLKVHLFLQKKKTIFKFLTL